MHLSTTGYEVEAEVNSGPSESLIGAVSVKEDSGLISSLLFTNSMRIILEAVIFTQVVFCFKVLAEERGSVQLVE